MEMLKEANKVLGYDLLDLCTNGPKDKLDNTSYAQVGAYTLGLVTGYMLPICCRRRSWTLLRMHLCFTFAVRSRQTLIVGQAPICIP